MELYCRVVSVFDQKIMDEFAREHKEAGITALAGDSSLILGKTYFQFENFYHWYKAARNLDLELKLKKNQVGCTCYLVFRKSDDRLIGIFDIRHSLDFFNGKIYGHVGADIRPSERSKGYYKDILKLVLEEIRNFSINKVIISCEYDNIASKSGIEHLFGSYVKMVPIDGTYLFVYQKYLDEE